ncbi:hypothetical protein ABH933_001227 [Nocardia sp. GP40]|uniref:hypothetical protein n=1 Tax=Nocardia sp. GP40 TaxID=3156268 RepID=UPI003D1D9CBE
MTVNYEIVVKRAFMAGHGYTGRWSWSVIYPNEYRPQARYGTASTPEKAFAAGLEALAELEEPERDTTWKSDQSSRCAENTIASYADTRQQAAARNSPESSSSSSKKSPTTPNGVRSGKPSRTIRKSSRTPTTGTEKGKPGMEQKPPPLWKLEEWAVDSVAEATDGCEVEPDGTCEHGRPSWLLALGLI